MKTVRPRPLCPVCPEHGPFKKFPVDAVNDGDHIRFPTKHRHKKSQRRRIQMGASRVCAHSHRTTRVKSQSKAWRSSSSSVDELKLDGVARVEIVRVARRGLVHDIVLRVEHAERERVRVAVHGEEGVARAVAGGIGVRLSRRKGRMRVSGSRSRRLGG